MGFFFFLVRGLDVSSYIPHWFGHSDAGAVESAILAIFLTQRILMLEFVYVFYFNIRGMYGEFLIHVKWKFYHY